MQTQCPPASGLQLLHGAAFIEDIPGTRRHRARSWLQSQATLLSLRVVDRPAGVGQNRRCSAFTVLLSLRAGAAAGTGLAGAAVAPSRRCLH